MTDKKTGTSIKTSRGWLRLNVSAPEYHFAERRIHVEQSQRLTIRLYPRRPIQQESILPASYTLPAWHPEPVYQVQPTLVLGLGGTGRHVLTYVKKNLLDSGFGKFPEKVRLALLDTPSNEKPVSFGDIALAPEEIVELSADLKSFVHGLRQNPDSDLQGWFPAEEYAQRLGDDEFNLTYGTRQRRPLSRAMLIQDLRQGISDEGIDVFLLIDCSASMEAEFQSHEHVTRLQAAKISALSFLSQLDQQADRVGVIAFAEQAQEVAPLSNNFKQTEQAIQSITLKNSTSIHAALDGVDASFARIGAAERSRVVILLSDGESNLESALAASERLKQKNIHIVSIGLGNASRELLEKISSSWDGQPDVFYAVDAQTLAEIYLRLARRMGQGSRVWRFLRSMASAVLENDSLRVVLVSSVAGGFGSAILSDIAYLARRVGLVLGAKSISVDAYLADAAVFSRVANVRYDVLQANAFATYREIERFQLAQGFPLKMTYDSHSVGNQVLNGTLNWRLFDGLYLFDHLPNLAARTDEQEARWFDPAVSVFPIMADSICFALDSASRAGPLREYRRNLQGAITSEQWARGRAVTGSVGVFRYLLPMQDIFEIFKTRWVIGLCSLLLGGETRLVENLHPTQNKEESEKNLDQHVRLFLLGYAGYESPACPPTVRAIGRILAEGRDVLSEIKSSQAWDYDSDAKAFGEYLRSALRVMLNGLGSSAPRVARAGKPGYVLAFLERLLEDLGDSTLFLGGTPFEKFCKTCLDEAKIVRDDFRLLLGRINASLVPVKSTDAQDDRPPASLFEQLAIRESHLLMRLRAQKAILSHEIVFDEADLDALFKDILYAPQYLDEAIGHFYWRHDEDGKISLCLNAWQNIGITADDGDISLLLDELFVVAAQAGKELLEKENLSIWAKTEISQITQQETISQQAWVGCQPLIRFTPQGADRVRPSLALAVRERGDFEWLAQTLSQYMPTEQQFMPVQIADPYNMSVVHTLDVIPFDALDNWNDHQALYNRWNGLVDSGQRDAYAEPTAVFSAEADALRWEKRLPQVLRQAPRLFSPLLITSFESTRAARLFALAFASGWVSARERELVVSPNGLTPILVNLPDIADFARQLSPYVMGMVYFCQQVTPSQVEMLEKALQSVDLDLWRRWTSPDWNRNDWAVQVTSSGMQDAIDFITYVAMVARVEFLKRNQTRS